MATWPDSEALRVLLVEDDEDDYLITKELLAGQDRARFKLDWCADFESALQKIAEQRHDIYLVDYRLGRRTGLELVRAAFGARPGAPVIILTGQSDYEIDLEATALGVTDYLVKHELTPLSLERSIRYAVSHQQAIGDLARSEERYALAVRAANDGIWDWDLETGRIYFSPRWHAILGRSEPQGDESLELWLELVHADDVERLRASIDLHLVGQTSHLESEHRMRHADGSWRWVLTRGLAIRGPTGRATRMAGSLSDINDRRDAELRLQYDALHDALTGLPNRALFMDRVEQLLRRSARDPSVGCSVLFLDIDRFKLVNDSLSHAVGDQLLGSLADRVLGVLREGDTIARIGGDEFTILLADTAAAADAIEIASRVQETLASAFHIAGHELVVTASIGIAVGSGSQQPSDLIRNADIAMYDAKRRGRGGCIVFDESMRRRVIDRLSVENELRSALEFSRLRVHFQPVVDLTTGAITGLEALARWPSGRRIVAPDVFIPVAEETGLIGPLGAYVMRTALQSLAQWRRAGLLGERVCMSVNVSPRQLDDKRLPAEIEAAIVAAGVPYETVRLEITESTLMQDPDRMREIVVRLCGSGVGLHLDDFGTGYSSLAALQQFPVNALKIDRGFVASMNDDAGSDAIVRSTIALAHSLGLGVIAEGIETTDQLRRLQALGCELGQGYLFSRPLAAEDAAVLFAQWSPSQVIGTGPRIAIG
ncbi:MAG: putative bifunctional diguanylate cyclase/phosphodiesterase [Solirubrobacteraceae bacterium]